ncbi:hypothetical protein TCAL_06924 [Tigriopus californicus]|uniref:GH18 domain-containing protein n=2 Tax=Tigriopus californicus TaxID=6832 RepID=A0A553NV96_TIGCA|nr:hypothetical protein TCAL_06924 [Tigriopus californicus]
MSLFRVLLFSILPMIALGQMFVESYWESWVLKDYPDDYCALLKDVPASPIGSTFGANYIDIAFGDYSGGFGGVEVNDSVIREGIEAIHAKGGKVKIAYGGALYSMQIYIQNQMQAMAFAQSLKDVKDNFGIDGVDFDVEDGGVDGQLQMEVMKAVRATCGDDFHISYTLPCLSSQFEPWTSTLVLSHQYLDAVNVMAYDYYWPGYSFDQDIAVLEGLGIPRSKMVFGLMPGHHDAGNEYTSLDEALNSTRFAKSSGLAGMMTWDINRDCDQRKGYPQGDDNLFQTGLPPATFLNTISAEINNGN